MFFSRGQMFVRVTRKKKLWRAMIAQWMKGCGTQKKVIKEKSFCCPFSHFLWIFKKLISGNNVNKTLKISLQFLLVLLKNSGSQDFDLILQYLDFLPHFSGLLSTCLDQCHILVPVILYQFIFLGKSFQSREKKKMKHLVVQNTLQKVCISTIFLILNVSDEVLLLLYIYLNHIPYLHFLSYNTSYFLLSSILHCIIHHFKENAVAYIV